VRTHAQELSDEVCDAHIRLYVNDYTVDLGEDGLQAIETLVNRAAPLAASRL
jgi:1,4-dihydroxy-6-naphthoate synthase